jgi:hypothetical protein
VAVVVDFSRLEAPRCKPEPGTNRARPLEGIGLLKCSDIGDGGCLIACYSSTIFSI